VSYSDVGEAITGVLRASGIQPFDWTASRNPFYWEAAIPMPVLPGTAFADTPFPFVVYELPESTIDWQFSGPGGDTFIETYRPKFYVVGNEKQRKTVLSPYAAGSLISYLDSLRNGWYSAFDGEFQCIKFMRQNYYLGKGDGPGTAGENVWVAQSQYELQFNVQ